MACPPHGDFYWRDTGRKDSSGRSIWVKVCGKCGAEVDVESRD